MKYINSIFISLIFFILISLISTAIICGNLLSDNVISQEVFGYLNIGGFSGITFGGLYLTNFTSPPNFGTITQIIAYLSTGGTSLKAVIYSDNNGIPGNLLAESEEVYQKGTPSKWIGFPISYTGASNRVYWLGIIFSSAGTYYYSKGVSKSTIYFSSQTTVTNTLPIGSLSPTDQMSIYATYTPSSSSQSLTEVITSVENMFFVIMIVASIIVVVLAILIVKIKKKNRETN